MRIIVTGGAGFLGSHLCERLLADGHEVVCIDNFITGRREYVELFAADPGYSFQHADVSKGIYVHGYVDAVMHFASPASPIDYLTYPIPTLKVGALGTHNALGLAKAKGAKFMLASTSEVYGDPEVHPQPESYWGNVNPIGPRGVYDEAKRFAEAMTMAYHRSHRVDTRIVRIFNSYGRRMRPKDGRAIPAFISAALKGEPLPVHGDGSQTRSFCYVSDMVEGFVRLLASDEHDPVNMGSPQEMSVLEMAELVIKLTGSGSEIEYMPRPVDDPTVRQPDISRAKQILGWEPVVPLEDGLRRTIDWFRTQPLG